jgi:hypothetical protein
LSDAEFSTGFDSRLFSFGISFSKEAAASSEQPADQGASRRRSPLQYGTASTAAADKYELPMGILSPEAVLSLSLLALLLSRSVSEPLMSVCPLVSGRMRSPIRPVLPPFDAASQYHDLYICCPRARLPVTE